MIRGLYRIHLTNAEEGISLDATALPNQINLDLAQCGYSSETVDEEIKLIFVIDQNVNRPLYFEYDWEASLTFPPFLQRTAKWGRLG